MLLVPERVQHRPLLLIALDLARGQRVAVPRLLGDDGDEDDDDDDDGDDDDDDVDDDTRR